MANISKFFLVENGLSFDDDVVIFSGASDPSSGIGESAPIGSVYLRTNGQLWQKFGSADTDWQLVSTEGTSVKVTSSDTTNGYLNDKLTVASSLLKSVIPSGVGPQTLQLDLNPTGVNAGAYTQVTVDSKGRVFAGYNPTTLLGYGITDAQPLHPNLTALSNISAGSPPVGLYTITGNGTSVARALVGITNQIAITNADGIAANPVIKIADNVILPGKIGMQVPQGTQADEQNSPDGTLRYDTTLDKFRFHQNGQWLNFGHDLLLYTENPVTPAAQTVSGQNAVAIGEGGIASGQNSVVIGTSTASGSQSTAIGNGAEAKSYGQVAISSRPYSSIGSSQGAEYIFTGQTISQYPIEIFLDNVSQRAIFTGENVAVTFTALIIAQQVDIPGGSSYSAKIDGQLLINGSTVTLSAVKSQFGVSNASLNADILADQTNKTFNVMVKGDAGHTYRWTVRVSTVESVL